VEVAIMPMYKFVLQAEVYEVKKDKEDRKVENFPLEIYLKHDSVKEAGEWFEEELQRNFGDSQMVFEDEDEEG
jgi:aminopeptidase N